MKINNVLFDVKCIGLKNEWTCTNDIEANIKIVLADDHTKQIRQMLQERFDLHPLYEEKKIRFRYAVQNVILLEAFYYGYVYEALDVVNDIVKAISVI